MYHMTQQLYLGIYLRENKIYIHIKTHTQMSIAALSVIVENCKQPRCPLRGAWLNKLGYHRKVFRNNQDLAIDICNDLDGFRGNYAK